MQHLWDEIRTFPRADRKALRQFGLVVGGVLAGIALVVWWRRDWAACPLVQVLGGSGGLLILLGLALPAVLRPVHRVWMSLALVLGYVMTNVLLTLVFFLAVTPIGLLLRLFGKDPMTRRPDQNAASYWQPRPGDAAGPERYERYY